MNMNHGKKGANNDENRDIRDDDAAERKPDTGMDQEPDDTDAGRKDGDEGKKDEAAE